MLRNKSLIVIFMKTRLLLPLVLFAILFTSCTKDKIETQPDTPEMAEARSHIDAISSGFTSGNWHITNCISSATNITSKYEDYKFAFSSNNSVVVSQNGVGLVGRWVVSYIDGKTRISFIFANNSGFDPINGDWSLVEEAPGRIYMQKVANANDLLTIEKN